MSETKTASNVDNVETMDQRENFQNSSAEKLEKPIDLDEVLTNELGQFGCFQLRNMILVSIPIIFSAFMNEYVFSAAAIPHRCQVPECGEYQKLHEIEPDWIASAIPRTSNGFASCNRFAPRNLGINGSLDYCPENLFNSSIIVSCDYFVYGRDNSVVYDFNLGCQEWFRALAGTLNSVGTLLVLPITGYISDRYGRKVALIINVFNLALFGLIRSFSVNYPMYLAFQILQTTLGAGTFSSAYIFAAELVGPKYRVFASAVITSMFATGQMTLGAVAWLVQEWRYIIMALHIPCFLLVCYYWILSESLRWLLSKKKYVEARKVLEKVAKVNKKVISEKSMEMLLNPPQVELKSQAENNNLFRSIIKSPVLLKRICITPIWWITTIFIYYGLSINSTNLSDTMYLNYILSSAVEIPGFFTAVLVLDRIGRKITICFGYFFCAACNIAFIFISSDLTTVRLVIFLLGKFGISLVMASMYLYTAELYPTEYRHSLLSFSSMVGRIGSITAPLTPALMDYWHGIPSALFGGMGVLSGILVFTQPETLGTKMPNTLVEAERLGQPESKVQS